MKNSRKRFTHRISILIISFVILGIQINAQTDRNELRLQNLKNRVAMAEAKVAAAEARLAKADSLITNGDLRIIQAEEEYDIIREEQKKLEKEYRQNSKALYKLTRSKDKETADKAEDDLKVLKAEYREESKIQETKIKNLTRQATRARSDIDKGLDMQKAANKRLKDAQKSLELARENYEAFKSTLESQ
jgi:chromosome segregation ATPase